MQFKKIVIFALIAMIFGGYAPAPAEAGPIGVGICYAGCAGLVCACFIAAGAIHGNVVMAAILANPSLTACNAAFSICEKGCVTVVLTAPTP